MEASVTVQTMEFIYSAVLGILLGMMYDIFRMLRVYLKPGKFITAVLDGVYWLLSILTLFAFVLTFSRGQMRWYVLVGAFCGGFVYICTASRLFFCALDIIIKLCIRLLKTIVKPIYFILGKALKAVRRVDMELRARAKQRSECKKENNTEE